MNEEELDSIEELIERKICLAEVSGGLTSSDKKFIDLWNYTIELRQENQKLTHIIEELEKWLEEIINEIKTNDIYDRTEYECTQIATLESVLAKTEQLKEEVK